MTESQWLTCTDPTPMLEFLADKVSDRKLRLFAVACCRRIWQHYKDQRSRHIVEVAESFADGAVTVQQLREAFDQAAEAQEAIHYEGGDAVDQGASEAVLGLREQLLIGQVFEGIEEAVGEARAGEAWERIYNMPGKDYRTQEAEHNEEYDAGAQAEQQAQADLLRDIIGPLPFRPITLSPFLLTSSVTNLARALYDERCFERMPILADALEEAGCDNAEVLAHCRAATPHVRGCWVVDLVLRKE